MNCRDLFFFTLLVFIIIVINSAFPWMKWISYIMGVITWFLIIVDWGMKDDAQQ